MLPHLDAAYNLARWLTRNDHDAEDVVQDAMLRALRFCESLRGGPETLVARELDRRLLNEAIAALPAQFREVIVLRELEDLSYKDIARIVDAPIGTVMSRLSRGRRLLGDSVRVIARAARPSLHE